VYFKFLEVLNIARCLNKQAYSATGNAYTLSMAQLLLAPSAEHASRSGTPLKNGVPLHARHKHLHRRFALSIGSLTAIYRGGYAWSSAIRRGGLWKLRCYKVTAALEL